MSVEYEVHYQGERISGILVKEDKDFICLKIKSGYNINLEKDKLKIIREEKVEEEERKVKNLNKESNLPKITILHTGGTIASKVDYETGAVSSKFTVEELLNLYPELNKIADLDGKMIGNYISEDLRFDHYNLFMKEIEKAISSGSLGIIISHGTDTLHYTAAALQYSLRNLPIPVVLVGSQRSSDRPSSDSYPNLKAATNFILENSKKTKSYRRVCICMHKNSENDNMFSIIDGINAKKMHSSRRDAFKQINFPEYATVSQDKIITINREDLNTDLPLKKLETYNFNCKLKVGFFKTHPHLFPEEIENLSTYDIVIIEGTGLGHMGINKFDDITNVNKECFDALKKLSKKTKLIIGSQAVYGSINLNVYSSGRYLSEIGILGNYLNLTTESLFIRAAHCFSRDKDNFEKLWEENLEGFKIRDIYLED